MNNDKRKTKGKNNKTKEKQKQISFFAMTVYGIVNLYCFKKLFKDFIKINVFSECYTFFRLIILDIFV